MNTNSYVIFLVVGVLMVVVDGQFIYHAGKRYLDGSKGDSAAEASMTRLIVGLFHLIVLGVLALISLIPFPGGDSLPSVVGRLGVVLLLLGLAHGIVIGVLNRQREEQAVEEMNARMMPGQTRAPIDNEISPAPATERQLNQPTVQPQPRQDVGGF